MAQVTKAKATLVVRLRRYIFADDEESDVSVVWLWK